ncbi:MAG: GNAT family N-acetyltransferase [Chloroflexota bacterium]|nr:GNAT family N-acetyltransferase [Chloroflexota bacterium]
MSKREKSKIMREELTFRDAEPRDAHIAAPLIFDTFPKVATFIVGLGSDELAHTILERLFELPGHRLSYEETTMAVYQGRVIGLLLSYPAHRMRKLDRKADRLILKQYRLRGKLALAIRAWPQLFMNQTNLDEYQIGNLAVRKRYWGRGVGTHLVNYAGELARNEGLNRLALRVAIENQKARELYERLGFTTDAIYLESNKRVAHTGAGYRRMVKVLS